jgi:hypothetical protein
MATQAQPSTDLGAALSRAHSARIKVTIDGGIGWTCVHATKKGPYRHRTRCSPTPELTLQRLVVLIGEAVDAVLQTREKAA